MQFSSIKILHVTRSPATTCNLEICFKKTHCNQPYLYNHYYCQHDSSFQYTGTKVQLPSSCKFPECMALTCRSVVLARLVYRENHHYIWWHATQRLTCTVRKYRHTCTIVIKFSSLHVVLGPSWAWIVFILMVWLYELIVLLTEY